MKLEEFTIKENLRGYDLILKSTFGLFSYKQIDNGTKLLIDTMEVNNGDICLDLACGYGVIGIVLAKLNPTGKIYLSDRDFVAVDYVKKNCELNNIKNYEAVLSNGFSHLGDIKFDLIVSNLPSHISNEMLKWILSDAKEHLKPNGRLYIVSVSKLKNFMKKQFIDFFGNYKKANHNKMHIVSLAVNEN